MKKLICLSFLGLVPLAGPKAQSQKAQEKQPNLVFIFPDQMRGSAMGFTGEEPLIKTPNLDQLAAEGVYFSQAVSNYPVCSPTRAMIFSGQYPNKNKVILNCTSKNTPKNVELQKETICWSDVLNSNGYSLGYIGKWHLDGPRKPFVKSYNNRPDFAWNEWCEPDRRHGFDYWYSYGTYDQHLNPKYWDTDTPRDSAFLVHRWGPEHEANMAIKYLKNEGDTFRDPNKPFAMVVAMNPPHTPYHQVPQRYKDIYKDIPVDQFISRPNIPESGTKMGNHYRKHIKNYYAAITGVDDQVGRILKCLKEQGLEENTIVVFTSDHGDCLGIHGHATKNNFYEEAMRVPMIIKWKGGLKPQSNDLLISIPDLYPTLLELMGFENKIPEEVQGKSYAKLLKGKKQKTPRAQLYFKYNSKNTSYGHRGIRTERYTFVIHKPSPDKTSYYLFDREKDPFQLENIYEKEPKLSKKLQKKLKVYLEEIEDPWSKHL